MEGLGPSLIVETRKQKNALQIRDIKNSLILNKKWFLPVPMSANLTWAVGNPGAGKSTFLNSLEGLRPSLILEARKQKNGTNVQALHHKTYNGTFNVQPLF